MAEPKPLTAYWMHEVIRISEPMTIGKHAWRLMQYRDTTSRYVTDETPAVFVGYEWRRLDETFEHWRQAQARIPGRLRAALLRHAESVHEGCSPFIRAFAQPPTPDNPKPEVDDAVLTSPCCTSSL